MPTAPAQYRLRIKKHAFKSLPAICVYNIHWLTQQGSHTRSTLNQLATATTTFSGTGKIFVTHEI